MKKKLFEIPANLKVFLLLILLIPFGIAFPSVSSAQATDDSGITPYVAVEEMPTFPGGNAALSKIIGEHLRYPANAQEKGIQGKVIVKFCVTAQGGVSMLSVLKGVDPDLDQEAMRVVKTLTKFNPGKKGGVPVPVWYLIPITFSLKEN
jgi:periplasmic protein TonB